MPSSPQLFDVPVAAVVEVEPRLDPAVDDETFPAPPGDVPDSLPIAVWPETAVPVEPLPVPEIRSSPSPEPPTMPIAPEDMAERLPVPEIGGLAEPRPAAEVGAMPSPDVVAAPQLPSVPEPQPEPEVLAALLPAWLAKMPERVAFVDVETTGLSAEDRVVSVAAVSLETAGLAEGQFRLKFSHVVCDPGRKSHPRAEAVHGYSDWDLRHQDAFADHAGALVEILGEADLVVGHHVEFDISFINRELVASGHPPVGKPTYCTMQACRSRIVGRVGLDSVAAQIGLRRDGKLHSAFEDAWLAMMIYLWLHDCPLRVPFSVIETPGPTNLRPSDPLPVGPLPRRKKIAPLVSFNADIEEPPRRYSDDHLAAAWELFDDRDYEAALDRAHAAIAGDEARGSDKPDSAPYEVACMILRRKVRLAEERDLLLRFFRRQIGPEVTREQILALSAPSWEVMAATAPEAVLGQRPRPAPWQMASRFARVVERLEKQPDSNEERLARALAELPNEAAFTEAAISLRKIISEMAKKRLDLREELRRLHRFAQQHAFFYAIRWDHPDASADLRLGLLPHVAAGMASAADLDALVLPYDEVGYEHLPLLNKTDVKRLVTAFGAPSAHCVPRERHQKIWEGYRREVRRLKRTGFRPVYARSPRPEADGTI